MADSISTQSAPLTRAHVIGWSWAFASQGGQVIVQAASFLLLAKSLPVVDLGAFVGICAVTSVLTPFAAMGTVNTLIKHVSRQSEQVSERWNKTVSGSCWFGMLASHAAGVSCRSTWTASV